ncbi:unnamed protein product [Brachionus calyciflorus]|uniref:Innexin n=1 Tax=Brachionus calyciflorus TaxID=104777 RepID=A0A813MCL1_9BILA|nr:unnamed protein product [Brachionus calyciflorus]
MIWNFLEAFTKVRSGQKLLADDKIDKFNRSFTVILLIIAAIFIGSKNFGTQITCLQNSNTIAPVSTDYINSVCLVKDVIILQNIFEKPIREPTMSNINTYAWLMLICLSTALIFYLPYLLWKYFIRRNTYNTVPIDISSIANALKNSSLQKKDDFANQIVTIADYLDRCFSLNNFNDSYLDEQEDFTKYLQNDEFKNREPKTYQDRLKNRKFKFFHVPLIFKYLFIKLIYVILSLGVFYLIEKMARFRSSFYLYGVQMFKKFLAEPGDRSVDTIVTSYFPYHFLCDVQYLGDIQDTQEFRFQCTLPANIFNEVVFFILWLWFVVLVFLNIYSLLSWVFKIIFRKRIITNMLIWPFKYNYRVDTYINSFVDEYLSTEGFLALMLIKSNTQDWHCRSIVRVLWKHHTSRLKNELEIPTPRIYQEKKDKLISSPGTFKLSTRRDINYEPLHMMEMSTPVRLINHSQKTNEKTECKNNFKIGEEFGSKKINEDMV